MGGIDLHAHTVRSDGTFTPTELVELALTRELSVLGVTDHDTADGLEEAERAAEGTALEIVPGVELSTTYRGSSVHVLCYWMDRSDPDLQAELARLRTDRFHRGERMVEKLRALGYPISFERVKQIAAGGNVVRPHIAQALVEAGVVPTEEDAFTQELIADGGRADVQKHALNPLDAMALIQGAGGTCVLAHPGMWAGQGSVPDELIRDMTGRGLSGIEADHPDHTPEQRRRYRAMAHDLGLVATGSSDCHGTRYDPVRLGTVTTDPEEFAALRERAARVP